MKKLLLSLILLVFWYGSSYAENWVMSDYHIPEKGWSESKGPIVFGNLVDPPPNPNYCDGSDKSLKFNVSILANNVGDAFDVNHIFVDGISTGEYALNVIKTEFAAHGQGLTFPYLLGSDWSDDGGYVYVCVGGVAQAATTNDALENIALWYDVSLISNGPTKEVEVPSGSWAKSGNLTWYPKDSSCENATIWRDDNTGQILANANTQSVYGGGICSQYGALPQCSIAAPSNCGSQGVTTRYFSIGVDAGTVPDPDQGYVDPVVNHKHAIGMHSVRYRMPDQSNWHYGEVSVLEGTNDKIDIRVKVKEKEGWDWTNVCVDLYHSENRWFSRSHDTKVSTKCIKTLDKKEKESRYFDNISISHLDIGHHYYFADIRYSRPGLDDHNISSRKDDTEYVVIDVQDPNRLPKGYVDVANCSVFKGWASDDDTSSPLDLHIYDGNTMIANIYADDYRSDVGYRGFTYTVPESLKDGSKHKIRVFAINEPQGSNPLLKRGEFSISCGNNGAMPTTRFYNSKQSAHFYSVNPLDQTKVPEKYPDWADHGYSFNAFPNAQTGTIPLYTCWTGTTHDYETNLSMVGYYRPCKETPWRLFDVYEYDGPNRKPVYLMYREDIDSLILSNGLEDAYYLQDTHGFGFTSEDPLFYGPVSLIEEYGDADDPENLQDSPLDSSIDEEEQYTTEEVIHFLLF
jgi:hypothetical protein